MTDEEHHEIVASLVLAHRQELDEAHALVVFYREALEAAGIEPPTLDGKMALERFRHVFYIAGHLDQMQHPELLADWWAEKRKAEERISYGRLK